MACHEMGHTVGLQHTSNSNSCMEATGYTPLDLSNHDVDHINGNY